MKNLYKIKICFLVLLLHDKQEIKKNIKYAILTFFMKKTTKTSKLIISFKNMSKILETTSTKIIFHHKGKTHFSKDLKIPQNKNTSYLHIS
jgi:hypothetical protein